MKHHVAHAVDDTLLFHDWLEARELWFRLAHASAGLVALCLMPDHVHVLTSVDVRRSLQQAMGDYTRWRNAHRGERGPAWIRMPEPTTVKSREKQRRDHRYIHLNPCRAHLAPDPLSWPFSTHREAVGLAVAPVRRAHRDPHGFHRYVSSDPKVHVQGTPLPMRAEADLYGEGALEVLWTAVSAVTRTPSSTLHREASARRLFIRAARTLTDASEASIAGMARVCRRTVLRAEIGADREVQIVERVCGDPRFAALEDMDLRERLRRRRRRP